MLVNKMIILLIALLFNPVSAGDAVLGEAKFNQNCKQCHGQAGMGLASYPKVSGNDIAYTIDRLKTYRGGIEVGANSALMIMMARPLSDIDIENLAAYLKEAKR